MRLRRQPRPVLQGEIVGRRGWKVDPEEGRGEVWPSTPLLRSSWAPRAWFPGDNQAFCYPHSRHAAPRVGCECGLHALYKPETVPTWLSGRLEMGLAIRGLVTAWGDIEAHVEGFRAEYARVAALVDEPKLLPGLARRIADHYKVPLISEEQWRDDGFITEFGEILPWEVRAKVGERRGTWRRPAIRVRSRRETAHRLLNSSVGLAAVLMIALHSIVPLLTVFALAFALSSTYAWSWWDQ